MCTLKNKNVHLKNGFQQLFFRIRFECTRVSSKFLKLGARFELVVAKIKIYGHIVGVFDVRTSIFGVKN